MKVGKLIKLLSELDPKSEVILASDAEGNTHYPLDSLEIDAIYRPDTQYSGDVFSAKWTADDAGVDEEEWEELLKGTRAVVLYPVN